MKQFKMKNTGLIIVVSLACLITACQPPATETQEVDLATARTEIQALEDAYAKASNEKNVEGILAYYADDAQRLPDGAPIVKGKDAIRKQVQDNMAADTTGSKDRYQVLEIFADGNLLVEVGASITTHKDGSEERGKYVAVYEKRDGKYVCILDIWNEDTDDDDGGDDD